MSSLPRFYVDHIEHDNGDVTWIVIDRQGEYVRELYSSVERAEVRLEELRRWTRDAAAAMANSRK